MESQHEEFVRLAMSEAEAASRTGNRPYGAVIVSPDRQLAIREHNRTVELMDPLRTPS